MRMHAHARTRSNSHRPILSSLFRLVSLDCNASVESTTAIPHPHSSLSIPPEQIDDFYNLADPKSIYPDSEFRLRGTKTHTFPGQMTLSLDITGPKLSAAEINLLETLGKIRYSDPEPQTTRRYISCTI